MQGSGWGFPTLQSHGSSGKAHATEGATWLHNYAHMARTISHIVVSSIGRLHEQGTRRANQWQTHRFCTTTLQLRAEHCTSAVRADAHTNLAKRKNWLMIR